MTCKKQNIEDNIPANLTNNWFRKLTLTLSTFLFPVTFTFHKQVRTNVFIKGVIPARLNMYIVQAAEMLYISQVKPESTKTQHTNEG